FIACGPSTEGQTKDWTRNKEKAGELRIDHPNFKAALDAEQKKAEAIWEEAGKLSDEEAKAEKMKAANEEFGHLVRRLGEVNSRSADLEKKISKLNGMKIAKSKSSERKKAVEKARLAISEVKAEVGKLQPTDGASGRKALDPHVSRLVRANSNMDKTIKKLGPKKKKKDKKKKKKDKKK
ncbi:MAG: hypothetical protein QF464_07565, partial [Myxococcota bacterium]|nr:hypothetical protein [Myxococcota bacterium]